jgi:hypothetical protein
MRSVSPLPASRKPAQKPELDVADVTQEIEAPFADSNRRDEPTLSKVDFDELEIKLDF